LIASGDRGVPAPVMSSSVWREWAVPGSTDVQSFRGERMRASEAAGWRDGGRPGVWTARRNAP